MTRKLHDSNSAEPSLGTSAGGDNKTQGEVSDGNKEENNTVELSEQIVPKSFKREYGRKKCAVNKKNDEDDINDKLLQIIQNLQAFSGNNNDELDEDRLFVLSLVPKFKKLPRG